MARSRAWSLLGLILIVGAVCCRDEAQESEIEMEIERIAIDTASNSPVVVLQDKAHSHTLPIWIGPAEAQAIALEMQGVAPPRPLTHDLVKTLLEQVGIQVRRVLIHELRGSTYYARIYLDSHGRDLEIDSRPSDAIALALRFKKPIFVTATLLKSDASTRGRSIAGEQMLTLGGITVQVLSRELADYFGSPPGSGVLVANVFERSTGLERGDIILEVDGKPIRDLEDFAALVGGIDGEAKLSVLRAKRRIRVVFELASSR
jgi:hypothetical protein